MSGQGGCSDCPTRAKCSALRVCERRVRREVRHPLPRDRTHHHPRGRVS